MLSYLIVGSGYRAEYFGRIAARYPGLFRAMFLCRSAEKAALVTAHTSVPATDSLDSALAFQPDFVIAAVDKAHMTAVAKEWALRNFPVVTETPMGASYADLAELRALKEQGAVIVSCEQYIRYPVLAAGLKAIRNGLIGTPISAYLSLAHDYHGFSLLTHLLQTENENYSLKTLQSVHPVAATDSRYGFISNGHSVDEVRDIAVITFESGKSAIYDFSSLQYRSFIRSRHLTVRGTRGEWSDRLITYIDEDNMPQRVMLMPEIPSRYRELDTQALRDLRKTWTPELFLETEQDEFAVATFLLDMGDYLQGGPAPYTFEEAEADARFYLALHGEG